MISTLISKNIIGEWSSNLLKKNQLQITINSPSLTSLSQNQNPNQPTKKEGAHPF